MTAPERRRPLPALAFIGALCLLTALVWFRVLHRNDSVAQTPPSTACPTTATTPVVGAKVLPLPKKVSVLVLNSTQRDGIATTTKKALHQEGFVVTDAADDKPAYGGHGVIKGVAEIRYGPALKPAAELLRYFFPGAALKATDSSSGVVTVSLGAAYTKVVPFTAVRKKLTKQGFTLSGKSVTTPTPSPSTC